MLGESVRKDPQQMVLKSSLGAIEIDLTFR